MAIADITVLGGGIFGLSIAWTAAARGARVRLIERTRIGAGSSGGLVGALAPHTPENWNPKKAFQLESLLMAESFWQAVADASGVDPGYARLGRLQSIADDKALALAQARAQSAQTLWQGRAEWRVLPADRFAGWGPSTPSGLVIFDSLTARLHPRQAAQALVAAIQAKGGQILFGEADPEGAVVDATGVAGLDRLSHDLGRPVGNGVKGQAALLGLDARNQPQLFLDGLHIIPHADGTTAIGSTSERDFDTPDQTDDRLDALIATARRLCPALANAPVLGKWAGVRPRARSRAPMLGQDPTAPNRFIANGGFKIGFGMAPKVAEVMVDLVLEGRDAIPDGFRVEDSF